MTPALRVLEYNLLVYRRTWRGSVIVSFISPLLFLAAMGLGLGSLVSSGSRHTVEGVSYLAFLAPGLLAATTMQTASSETTFPILAKVYWEKTYEAMLATPLDVRALLSGEVGWLTIRLTTVAASFFVVMALFGVIRSPLALLAIPAAVLNGLAFAIPILAFTATQRKTSGFSALTRFIILPLFLLAGTFFPIQRLPAVLQAVVWVAPLSHGVALTRSLTVGGIAAASALMHLAVLIAYAVAGTLAARVALRRRLVT